MVEQTASTPKGISILGSTGSIGVQTLEVVDLFPERFQVVALTAGRRVEALFHQVKKYRPRLVAVADVAGAEDLADRLTREGIPLPEILTGPEGMKAAAVLDGVEIVVTAVSGAVGLLPTLEAIRLGKTIALANKETLVAAGALVMEEARRHQVAILPVDSEHSAIFQCLEGHGQGVKRLVLTASGGPFRGKTREELQGVTPQAALKHPNWDMGKKISIDSATLMNKGLEVIEAHWLFGVDFDDIEVVVHPQSIVHSLVEFVDGAFLAHLGQPDMRIPIQYALTFPERWANPWPALDLTELTGLTFQKPDRITFPALDLAFRAGRAGGTLPAVMNAANEVAVEQFLAGKISFLAIAERIAQAMEAHSWKAQGTLEEILEGDRWAREYVASLGV